MHIYIQTDMEGVAGIINSEDWCMPGGRYYDKGKALVTAEVNAAIEGLLAGGASGITVSDSHGYGGIDGIALHAAAELKRGNPTAWPHLLDEREYDAVVWVGQHAKAGTSYAHLAHTGTFRTRDLSVNGVAIGEYGRLLLCAAQLGVRAIFASGDRAFTEEVEALTPGVETVAVKRGTQPDPGHCLPHKAYARHNIHAIHLSPQEACGRIRDGAQRAIERARREEFGLLKLDPPYECIAVLRSDEDNPPRISRKSHPSSIIELFNSADSYEPIEECDPLTFV